MARRGDALGVTGAETLIGTGVVVEGTLSGEGDISIDGTVTGTVQAEGNVTIGVNAQVYGAVNGVNVVVAGTLEGPIIASGEASIRESGRVIGDITALSLAVSSGGVFQGMSQMTGDQRAGLPHPDTGRSRSSRDSSGKPSSAPSSERDPESEHDLDSEA